MSGKIDREKPLSQVWRRHSVSGYLRYIGTREQVELLPDDRPPTRKQEQLVRKLTKDFPEAKNWTSIRTTEKPTKPNASAFITRALEENWSAGAAVRRLHEVHRHPAQGGAAG